MTPNRFSPVLPAILALVAGISISYAQTIDKVQGHIKARSGALLIVQNTDSGEVPVLLNDDTKTGQSQGLLKVRHKEMSMAALIPGLAVQVEGTYNGQK